MTTSVPLQQVVVSAVNEAVEKLSPYRNPRDALRLIENEARLLGFHEEIKDVLVDDPLMLGTGCDNGLTKFGKLVANGIQVVSLEKISSNVRATSRVVFRTSHLPQSWSEVDIKYSRVASDKCTCTKSENKSDETVSLDCPKGTKLGCRKHVDLEYSATWCNPSAGYPQPNQFFSLKVTSCGFHDLHDLEFCESEDSEGEDWNGVEHFKCSVCGINAGVELQVFQDSMQLYSNLKLGASLLPDDFSEKGCIWSGGSDTADSCSNSSDEEMESGNDENDDGSDDSSSDDESESDDHNDHYMMPMLTLLNYIPICEQEYQMGYFMQNMISPDDDDDEDSSDYDEDSE